MDQNINTNITATANFSALTTQLQAITAELVKLQTTTIGLNKNLSTQAGVMNRAFADTLRSTGQFSTHFVTLSNDVTTFGKNLDSGRLKLSQYYNVWQGHMKNTTSLVKDLAKQQVMLENAVIQPLGKNAQGLMQYNVNVATGIDAIKNKTALARQEMTIMNKVMQDGANQLINWGKNTQWAGRQLTVGLTVPLAAFGAAAQQAFLQADQELTRLAKVYGGLSAVSQSELQKVRKDVSATAKELASSYGASYKETIALAADIAATGATGNDLLQRTVQTTRLAVLGEVSRQDAMKATLTIQNTFKQNTDQLAQSIDFLNAVENQTSTTLSDLTDAIPKAGPVFKALGGNVKDLSLMLVAMKEGGIDASSGANALKSAMASLVNPTKVATDMFNKFGIDLKGIVTRDTGNITQMILDLQKALEGLTPLQKSQAIEQLFGKFQFSRMSALFQNLGKQGSQTLQVMDLMKASATDLANISARELKQQTESASGRYKRALASVQADLATTGQGFLKISTLVLNTIDKIVQFVNHLPGPIKTVLGFLGGLTAVAGPLIMLTGVLGNFFGYIIKGIFHLKQLAKGGATFKLLTPEIMAAQKAGTLMADSFYSDAKATAVLADAVYTLAKSFDVLKAKALDATTIVNNGISTVAGNEVVPNQLAVNGERVANKNHPLIGKPYSRDMVHLIPTASQTDAQKMSQTIFSTVPGPKPVNQRIGNNPQIYMQGNLPKIQGVTAINGVSTGIVAEEAAKWHAMTAAIATQSETELAALKQEVAATGTITESLSTSYQKMLPPMMELTSMAAKEAEAIVQELSAGKITVDVARAKIFELNATVEAMMAETSTQIASGMGRGINLTTVPLTTQSVVNANGTSNMKELFHKSSTSNLLDKIARVLGVRTSGGGYSTETTIPKKLNTGGPVYLSEGSKNVVPGKGNTDTVPAMLTPGEFVINKKATEKNFSLLQAINNGYNVGGKVSLRRTHYGIPQINGSKNSLMSSALYGLKGFAERLTNPNYDEDFKLRSIIHDASVLNSLGVSEEDSISKAKHLFEEAKRQTLNEKTGRIDEKHWMAVRQAQITAVDEDLRKNGLRPLISKTNTQGISPSSQLLKALSSRSDINQVAFKKIIDTYKGGSQFVSEHVIPRKEWIDQATKKVLVAKGNFGMAIAGNDEINKFTNYLRMITDGKHQDKLPLTQVAARDLAQNISKNLSYKDPETLLKSMNRIKAGIMSSEMRALLTRGMRFPSWARRFAFGGRVPGSPFTGRYKSPLKWTAEFIAQREAAIAKSLNDPKLKRDANGNFWYDEQKYPMERGKHPQPKSYYQDMTNDDPTHGALQIGKYRPAIQVRSQHVAPIITYKSNLGKNWMQQTHAPAFEIGTLESRAKSALFNYMQGDYSAIDDPAVQQYLSTLRTKFTGTLHRGVRNVNSLPPVIRDLIHAGRWQDLVGKEFIMRRSSWSTNKDTAAGFGQLQLIASVKNRNAVPASQIFPDLTFHSAKGPVHVNESEVYMGGKFRVVAAGKNAIKLQAVVDGQREHGGPVSGGRSYLVGEKGPEIFTPQGSGKIVPHYALGGIVKGIGLNLGLGLAANMIGGKVGGSLGQLIQWAPMLIGMAQMGTGAMRGRGNIDPEAAPVSRAQSVLRDLYTPKRKLFSIGEHAMSTQPFAPAEKLAGRLATAGAEGGKFAGVLTKMGPMLARLPMLFNPVGLAVAGVTAAVLVGIKIWKDHQKYVRLNALGFGLTAEAAKKAGLKYKDYNSSIKSSMQSITDLKARNELLYKSLASSGTPLKITIAQYAALKKEVKSVFKDQIETINQTDKSKVGDLAVRLKEQFINAGMSAEDATKKIYAMFQVSNKAGQASSALFGNKAFNDIKDAKTSSVGSIQSYGSATKTQREGSAQAAALNTAMQGIDAAIAERMSQSAEAAAKDKTGKTKALTLDQAEKAQIDAINKAEGTHAKLTEATLKELEKTNPEIRKFASTSDTVVSVWQKLRLQAAGFQGDLSKLNDTQTAALSSLNNTIQDTVTNANKNGLLKDQYKNLDKLTAAQKALTKAAAGQSVQQQIDSKKIISDLQKQIDATNKLAEARIKALDAAQADADLATAIAKKKLEIAQAIGRGDQGTAQQGQLDLQNLNDQQQHNAQVKAIQDAAEKENAPRIAKIEALNNANNTAADAAALAASKLNKVSDAAQSQKDKIDAVNTAMSTFELGLTTSGKTLADYLKTEAGRGQAAVVATAAKNAGIDIPKTDTKTVNGKTIKVAPTSPEGVTSALVGGTGGLNDQIGTMAQKLGGGKTLADIVNAINGNKDMVSIAHNTDYDKKGWTEKKKDSKTKKEYTVLNAQARHDIALKNKFKEGDSFLYDGIKYALKNGNVIVVDFNPASSKNAGMATGGLIKGPGTGTSDSILAKLSGFASGGMLKVSNGEYVIRAASVAKYGVPALDAINSGKFHVPSNNYSMKHGMQSANGIEIINNIYPSPDMNTDQLVQKVTAATVASLGQMNKVNAKMVGVNRSI